MKKLLKYSLFLSITGILILGCQSEKAPEGSVTEKDQSPQPLAINLSPEQMELAGVKMGKPEQRVISETIACAARIDVPPQSLASVYTPVQGFVKMVKLLPGDYVKKGSLLTTVSHPDLVRLQREFLEINSRLQFLQSDYERKLTLTAEDAASQRALEEAKAEFELANARYKGLKAELNMIGINTLKLGESGAIQPSINLYAPVNGFISKVNVNLGKLVTPNDLLFELVDDSHTHLELEIFAKDLNRIRKGQLIECHFPGETEIYQAEVHLTGKVIDKERRTAVVHGHFRKQPVTLPPGAYLQAIIYIDEAEVWAVPESALVRSGNEAIVFVRSGNGFEKRRVIPGRTDGAFVEISSLDLQADEMIAIVGAYYLNASDEEE